MRPLVSLFQLREGASADLGTKQGCFIGEKGEQDKARQPSQSESSRLPRTGNPASAADEFAQTVLPVIRAIQAAGTTSLASIADGSPAAKYGGYRRRAMMRPSRKAIARDWRGASRVKFAKRSRGRSGWRPALIASAMRWFVVSTASVAVRTASVASASLVCALAPDVSSSSVI